MVFGIGYYEMISLIIGELLDSELIGKLLLDMGCGILILVIFVWMWGVKFCIVIDIDEWCVCNLIENIELNGVIDIVVL